MFQIIDKILHDDEGQKVLCSFGAAHKYCNTGCLHCVEQKISGLTKPRTAYVSIVCGAGPILKDIAKPEVVPHGKESKVRKA